jgi:hypothetical protein
LLFFLQVSMEGLDAVHDDAVARGWSPQQLHRLTSYMLGANAVDGGFSEALRDNNGACAALRHLAVVRGLG